MTKPFEERFWSKVQKSENCWNWTAYKDKDGYGVINLDGSPTKKIRAHRASYQMHFGCIPEGMVICHICDNPGCVKPEHLWAGSSKENSEDMVRKGRQFTPTKNLVTICVICTAPFKTRKNGKRGEQFCCSKSCAAFWRAQNT